MRIVWILFLLITYSSCKQSGTNKKNNGLPSISTSTAHLTAADIQSLAKEADFVDIIFYHLNISVSQNDPPSVRQSVGFLTDAVKPAIISCLAIGRITYLAKGKILKEADIHISSDCHYFTIIENKIGVGTALISPDGIRFFQTLLDSYKAQ